MTMIPVVTVETWQYWHMSHLMHERVEHKYKKRKVGRSWVLYGENPSNGPNQIIKMKSVI